LMRHHIIFKHHIIALTRVNIIMGGVYILPGCDFIHSGCA